MYLEYNQTTPPGISMENGIPVYLEEWWHRRQLPGRRLQQRTSNCQQLSDFLVLKQTIFTKSVIKSNRLSVFCFRSHEKVWLSFKQKLLISQGKFYRCFGVRVPPRIKEGGNQTLNHTCTQSFINTLSYQLAKKLWVLF